MLPKLFLRNFTPLACVFVIVAITLFATGLAPAQVSGATLTGTVQDTTGPGVSNPGFSLIQNSYVRKISETFNAQFRAEFFNILNRPIFAPSPFPNIFNSSGNPNSGCWESDRRLPQHELQFALKFTWSSEATQIILNAKMWAQG